MKKILKIGLLLTGMLGIIVPFAEANDKPEFPGGADALKKYISDHTKYPQIAKENGIEGIVEVGFIVMEDGKLNEIKVIRLVDPDLENEAIRVVSGMPVWIPAEKDGSPISAPAKVDVPFILE